MNYLFEFSVKKMIASEEVIFLANRYFSDTKIRFVEEEKFWDIFDENGDLVGVHVINLEDVFETVVQATANFSPKNQMKKFYKLLASTFQTDVVFNGLEQNSPSELFMFDKDGVEYQVIANGLGNSVVIVNEI